MTKRWELALGVCSSCGILFQMLLFPQLDQNRAFITTFQAILAFAMQLSQLKPTVKAKMLPKRGQWQPQVVDLTILSFAIVVNETYPKHKWYMFDCVRISCLLRSKRQRPLLGWFSCRTFSHQPRDVLKIFMDPVLILVEMFIPRSLSLRLVWFCLDDSIFLHIFYISLYTRFFDTPDVKLKLG